MVTPYNKKDKKKNMPGQDLFNILHSRGQKDK